MNFRTLGNKVTPPPVDHPDQVAERIKLEL
jgi:hypothetical protein